MLKRTLCKAELTWQLSCEGPLLINDGRYDAKAMGLSAEDNYPKTLFMSSATQEQINRECKAFNKQQPNLSFYVPGTSIRGPFRAQAERIVRTLCKPDVLPPSTACDPFQGKDKEGPLPSCGQILETEDNDNPPYVRVCPACRLFGCPGLASRIQFSDAPVQDGYTSIYRDMIGIDRFTGGVSKGANMKQHVLENTQFETRITITNFELWHMGLLGYVLQDFRDGLVPIGFGKSKGFGRVAGRVTAASLTFCRKPEGVEHMGSLMSDKERQRYGILENDPLNPEGFDLTTDPDVGLSWYHRCEIKEEDQVGALFKAAALKFNQHIDSMPGREEEAA